MKTGRTGHLVTIASPFPASLWPCCLLFTALPGWAPGLCCYCSGHSAPGPPFPAGLAPHCDEQGPVWPAASVPRLPKALLLTGAEAAFLQAPSGCRAFTCFLPAGYCPDSFLSAFRSTQVSGVGLLPWLPSQNVASSSVPPLPLLVVSLSHHRLRDTLCICCLAAITDIEVFCRLVLPAALFTSVFPDSGIVSVGDRC